MQSLLRRPHVCDHRRRLALLPSPEILGGDEPEVARELRGAIEAPPVDVLRREHHRRVERDAAAALQAPDHWGERRQERELLALPIQLVAPLQFVEEERMILAIDEPVMGREGDASVVRCWSHFRCGVHQFVPSRKTKPRRARNMRK
jgi:hypothetical protein